MARNVSTIHLTSLALAAGVLLAGCDVPPEARSPLSDAPTADYDARLIGNWVMLMDDDPVYLKVDKGNAPKTLQAVFTMVSRRSAAWGHLTAYATDIGGKVYYNVRRSAGKGADYTAPGEKPGVMIMQLVFLSPDIMAVCTIHAQTPTNASAAKMLSNFGLRTRKVSGSVEGDKSDYLIIEGTGQDLQRAIAAAPAEELFGGYLPFVRLGTPKKVMDDVVQRMKARQKAGKKGCPLDWVR